MIKGFMEVYDIFNINISKSEAYKIFNELKEKNIILNSKWDNMTWTLSDQIKNVSLHFSKINSINKYNKKEINHLCEEAKVFVCSLFNKLSLLTIQSVLNNIARFLDGKDPSEQTIPYLDLFFSNIEGYDFCLEKLDEYQSDSLKKGKRDLASFETYFLFNDLINKFWNETTDIDEKLFFAPIYFWWNITTIFPTRPIEFIITPRNCLSIIDNKYHLKLRKNKIKGNKKRVSYSIIEDYDEYDCIIPNDLGNEIKWYIENTDSFPSTDIDSLFRLTPHYNRFKRSIGIKNRFLTYSNFHTIFRLFYQEIIMKRFHYKIIYDRSITNLNPGEIQIIKMGDARHISLINIVAEGGTPLTAMYLAGHNNPSMSAHYFSNIATLIECKTYRLYRGQTEYQLSEHVPIKTRQFIEIAGGRCYNEKIINNKDYGECLNATGKYGEVGFCKKCVYYRGEKMIDYKEELEQSSKHFLKLIESFRKGNGSKESLIAELLNIQNKANNYQKFLMEEKKNGKTETN